MRKVLVKFLASQVKTIVPRQASSFHKFVDLWQIVDGFFAMNTLPDVRLRHDTLVQRRFDVKGAFELQTMHGGNDGMKVSLLAHFLSSPYGAMLNVGWKRFHIAVGHVLVDWIILNDDDFPRGWALDWTELPSTWFEYDSDM